jgi:uncharacterized repeat protein (TIGR03803 family)
MSIAYLRMSALALVLTFGPIAGAQTYKVLYSFTGGIDGGGVWGGVVMDKQGNLYGTTSGGGAYGYGTVFQLSPNADGTWTETVLHSFANGDVDGQEPESTLIMDGAGNLYGTAPLGGSNGHGTAFQLSLGSGGWMLTLLYSFCAQSGCTDGAAPDAGLVMDSHGNLFGAGLGGAICCGAVVELSHGANDWTESVVYSFGANGGVGGADPFGGLLLDGAGDLYGTTYWGGDLSCGTYGCGVIYGLRHASSVWKESVLHRFGTIQADGAFPGSGKLALDAEGNLYGATLDGGNAGCTAGCGTIFKAARKAIMNVENPIHRFGSGTNGAYPIGGVVFDAAGNFYGVTGAGGQTVCDCGVIYKMTPTPTGGWVYSVLHALTGADGAAPNAGLAMDGSGNLFGTAVIGGPGGSGVVFEILP